MVCWHTWRFINVLISILIVVGTCTRSCARVRVSRQSRARRSRRVSRQSRARRSRVSACRGEAALRPPCGRAQLVIIKTAKINVKSFHGSLTTVVRAQNALSRRSQSETNRCRKLKFGTLLAICRYYGL